MVHPMRKTLAFLLLAACSAHPEARSDAPPVHVAAPTPPSAVPSPAPPAAPQEVSMKELYTNPTRYEGQRVVVRGEASSFDLTLELVDGKLRLSRQSGPMCTLLFCGPGNDCCNHCGGGVSLMGGFDPESGWEQGIALAGEGLGCSGTECSVACNPMEKQRHRVTAVFRLDEARGAVLQVESIVPE
jgi:hypothetical protein